MPFFSPQFKRQLNPEGRMMYWFQTSYKQTEGSPSWNEIPPLAVEGEIVYSDPNWAENADTTGIFERLPEEVSNPTVLKAVFEHWIQDCSGAFVHPPTLTQCLANVTSIWDSNAPTATLLQSEEDKDWVLQWIPTKIKVDKPLFQVFWSPLYKTLNTRIPERIDIEGKIEDFDDEPELQGPEKTYTILPTAGQTRQGEWLQEIPDLQVPLSEGPALRLESDQDVDPRMERARQRVREARIRAKLARYKAERMAQRFEDRFGFYPSEDDEEAETEAEMSGMD